MLDGDGTDEEPQLPPKAVIRRADQFNIPKPAEPRGGDDGAGTSPALSPTYSDAGRRLPQKASVEKIGMDTIEGKSSATKEADQVDHQGCKTGAVEPRAHRLLH